jgi:hypothetical protein
VQINTALYPVERVIGGRFELDAGGFLRREIGKTRHRQGDQRNGDERDDWKQLLQGMMRSMSNAGPLWASRRANTMARPAHRRGWHIT